MKVIFIKDVQNIGKAGDAKEVSDGFARNFLIPGKLALESTTQNLRKAEEIKIKTRKVLESEKQKAQEFADKLSKASCTVGVQVGPDEKLYGSVTPADIQQALETEGFQLDKKQITIDTAIEKLGVYHVKVKIHPQVEAAVKVWVVKK